MTAVEVLAELDRRELRAEVADGTRLLIHGTIPPTLADHIRAHKAEMIAALSRKGRDHVPDVPSVVEIERRVTAFRQQLREWQATRPHDTALPFFVLCDAIEFPTGTCVSCGDPVPERPAPRLALRCDACVLAAEVILTGGEAMTEGFEQRSTDRLAVDYEEDDKRGPGRTPRTQKREGSM
jgi:hypothetical protein